MQRPASSQRSAVPRLGVLPGAGCYLGEDACRVRSGQAPHVLAAVRNPAITLLSAAGWKNKASAGRRYAARPEEAHALLEAPAED